MKSNANNNFSSYLRSVPIENGKTIVSFDVTTL